MVQFMAIRSQVYRHIRYTLEPSLLISVDRHIWAGVTIRRVAQYLVVLLHFQHRSGTSSNLITLVFNIKATQDNLAIHQLRIMPTVNKLRLVMEEL